MIPIVGSHVGRTWNSNTSSQLHGGYVKVNSAAKKRAPKSVCSTQSCAPAPWGLAFRIHYSFSASTAKSVISGVKMEWGKGLYNILTDVLKMAQTQKLSCLPKQAPLTHGTGATQNRIANMAGSSPPWAPTIIRAGKFPLPLKTEKYWTISMSNRFYLLRWIFM